MSAHHDHSLVWAAAAVIEHATTAKHIYSVHRETGAISLVAKRKIGHDWWHSKAGQASWTSCMVGHDHQLCSLRAGMCDCGTVF